MWYLEFLRMRKSLVVYAALLFTLSLFSVIVLKLGHVAIGTDVSISAGTGQNLGMVTVSSGKETSRVPAGDLGMVNVTTGDHTSKVPAKKLALPLVLLFGFAGFCAILFAAAVGPSLNRESDHLDYVFTKPLSRERIAISYFLIDVAGLIVAFAVAFVICCMPLVAVGLMRFVYLDPAASVTLALLVGMAFMWYAEKQAATSWYQGPGVRAVILFFILFMIVLPGLAAVGLPPVFQAAVMAINFLNPLAYLDGINMHAGAVSERSLLSIGMGLRVALVWSIGLVCCVVAVAGWKRVEA